jgi:hypothetical protein
MLVRPAAFSLRCCSTSASIVSGGGGGSCTSDFARSTSSPFSSPCASRVMRPPGSCGVSFVMFHFLSAAEFRMYSWPAANDHHGVVGRHGVEIAAVREAVLLELGLVPVAVGGDDVAGPRLFDARGDCGEPGERSGR